MQVAAHANQIVIPAKHGICSIRPAPRFMYVPIRVILLLTTSQRGPKVDRKRERGPTEGSTEDPWTDTRALPGFSEATSSVRAAFAGVRQTSRSERSVRCDVSLYLHADCSLRHRVLGRIRYRLPRCQLDHASRRPVRTSVSLEAKQAPHHPPRGPANRQVSTQSVVKPPRALRWTTRQERRQTERNGAAKIGRAGATLRDGSTEGRRLRFLDRNRDVTRPRPQAQPKDGAAPHAVQKGMRRSKNRRLRACLFFKTHTSRRVVCGRRAPCAALAPAGNRAGARGGASRPVHRAHEEPDMAKWPNARRRVNPEIAWTSEQ